MMCFLNEVFNQRSEVGSRIAQGTEHGAWSMGHGALKVAANQLIS
jgi:hypothetical protein